MKKIGTMILAVVFALNLALAAGAADVRTGDIKMTKLDNRVYTPEVFERHVQQRVSKELGSTAQLVVLPTQDHGDLLLETEVYLSGDTAAARSASGTRGAISVHTWKRKSNGNTVGKVLLSGMFTYNGTHAFPELGDSTSEVVYYHNDFICIEGNWSGKSGTTATISLNYRAGINSLLGSSKTIKVTCTKDGKTSYYDASYND